MRVRGLQVAVVAIALCAFVALGDAQAQVRGLEGGNQHWTAPRVTASAQVGQQQQLGGDAKVQVESKSHQHQLHADDDDKLDARRHRPIIRQSPHEDFHPQRQLQKTESLISWVVETAHNYWLFKLKSKREEKAKKEEEAKKNAGETRIS